MAELLSRDPYEVRTTKLDLRDHPNSKRKHANEESVGEHLESHMNNEGKAAWDDPNGDCANWEEDDKSQRCHDTVC